MNISSKSFAETLPPSQQLADEMCEGFLAYAFSNPRAISFKLHRVVIKVNKLSEQFLVLYTMDRTLPDFIVAV